MTTSTPDRIDLTPLRMHRVNILGKRMAIDPPLEVVPFADKPAADCPLQVCAQDDSLGLHVYALTAGHLPTMIEGALEMLWVEFALEDPDELSIGGRALRGRLLERIKEVP